VKDNTEEKNFAASCLVSESHARKSSTVSYLVSPCVFIRSNAVMNSLSLEYCADDMSGVTHTMSAERMMSDFFMNTYEIVKSRLSFRTKCNEDPESIGHCFLVLRVDCLTFFALLPRNTDGVDAKVTTPQYCGASQISPLIYLT
jgi:hypothetical protein